MRKLFLALSFLTFAFSSVAQQAEVYCFAPGTKIAVSETAVKNVEEIKKGDKILCFNTLTREKTIAAVEKTASAKRKNLVTYTFEDGSSITATDDHPFMTQKGWSSLNPSKTASYKGYEIVSKIETGDTFLTVKGKKKLVSTSLSSKSRTTYTIVKLSFGDAFYANGILSGTESL